MDKTEKTLQQNLIYKGRILDLYNDNIELADGSTSQREYIKHNGGSGVLAIDSDDYIYLVEQYRYPYGELLLEIPAGKVDKNESFAECAVRELQEETGLIAQEIQSLGIVYPSPGYTNEPLHIFLAQGLEQGQANLDEGEIIDVVKILFSDALDMVMQGRIADAKTSIAILKLAVIRSNKAC